VACGYESQPVYDDEGYDQCGYDREGYDRNGYNREGYDRNGYDKKGYDQAGYNKEGFDRYGYDRSGYDHEGYDRKGYDHDGYDRNGYDCYGYDINGFDREGYNREGYDTLGCKKSDLSCGKASKDIDPVVGAPEEGVLYFHPDYTGNISYTTDSVGTVKTRIMYMPYGDAIVLEGENNFRYKFNTHEQDKTGLQYFNARYYDPEIGRFAQADPTIPDPLNSQAFNRYMMCLGNPISYADVNGFQASTSPTYGGTVTTVNGGVAPAAGTMGAPSISAPAAASAPSAPSTSPSATSPSTSTSSESAEGGTQGEGDQGGGDNGSRGPGYSDTGRGKNTNPYAPNNYSSSTYSDYSTKSNMSRAASLSKVNPNNTVRGRNFSLPLMYFHYQFGLKAALNINMSSIDFSHTSQSELGLSGMEAGEYRAVNLFAKTGVNSISLAFGRAGFVYQGNNQFSMVDKFNFDPLWDTSATNGRNIGNIAGFLINQNVPIVGIAPLAPVVPIIFGGGYEINFVGTTYIKP